MRNENPALLEANSEIERIRKEAEAQEAKVRERLSVIKAQNKELDDVLSKCQAKAVEMDNLEDKVRLLNGQIVHCDAEVKRLAIGSKFSSGYYATKGGRPFHNDPLGRTTRLDEALFGGFYPLIYFGIQIEGAKRSLAILNEHWNALSGDFGVLWKEAQALSKKHSVGLDEGRFAKYLCPLGRSDA